MSTSITKECPVCNGSVAFSGFPYREIESHHRTAFMWNGVPCEMTCEGSYRKDYEGYNGE
jgi:hypothetical protein